MCCLIESPSSLMGQFQRKNASLVPRSPGLSWGTKEWLCPGMVNPIMVNRSIKIKFKSATHLQTRLYPTGGQIELRETRKIQ